MEVQNFKEAALEYARCGFAVFPLKPKEKSPLVAGGVLTATTDEFQINRWWDNFPNANIGIALGSKSGVIAIDVDFKDGCDPEFPDRLPPTVTCGTPTGGFHIYFKYPYEGIKNGLKLETGATIRADGYYVVAPPSIHPETKTAYIWKSRPLGAGEIEDCPDWILELNTKTNEKKERYEIPKEIKKGERNTNFWKTACSLRARGFDEMEIYSGLVALNERTSPSVPDEELRDFARRACKYDKGISGYEYTGNWSSEGVSGDSKGDGDKRMESSGGEKTKEAKKKKRQAANKTEELAREILDVRFKLFVDNERSTLYNIKNIKNKELVICQNEEGLLRRLKTNLHERFGDTPDIKFVKLVYDMWRLSTDGLLEEPKPFTWSNEDEWSFKKLSFYPTDGAFPAWEEFLERLSSRDDFMAYIWSVFELKNKSRQFLYLHDPVGEGGKSTVIRVLGRVFGGAFSSLSNSTISGSAQRWLLGQLYGKRLVAWADCKNPKFCMSELVRNITSGDPVSVEFKGQAPFSTEMYVKLIVGSNHEPQITSGGADTSRLINLYVKENTNKKDDPDWENRLWNELPQFLYSCREVYKLKCPNHGKILLDESSVMRIDDATEGIESRWYDIINRKITVDKKAETSVSEWLQLCRDERLDNNETGNFKEFLKRIDGVSIKRKIIDGQKKTIYHGFSIKQNSVSTWF